jgi:hypothetical protein
MQYLVIPLTEGPFGSEDGYPKCGGLPAGVRDALGPLRMVRWRTSLRTLGTFGRDVKDVTDVRDVGQG